MLQVLGPDGLGRSGVPEDVPALLALGHYDFVTPPHLWEEPMARMRQVTSRFYERSGHHPPYEQPQEFAADLVEWTASI